MGRPPQSGTAIELYDTTLRDGMQGEGMSLSAHEKVRVAHTLDELGVDVIEAGFPSSNPKELELFELLARERFEHAQIAAFGMTRRRGLRAQDDVIFPVALGGSLRTAQPDKKKKPTPGEPRNPLSFAQSTADLQALATMTGGRAFFPESPNDFVPAYRQIAAALRHEYVLGIAPQHDGKFHLLEVQLVGPDGQPLASDAKNPAPRIFAREGYQAPAESPSPAP